MKTIVKKIDKKWLDLILAGKKRFELRVAVGLNFLKPRFANVLLTVLIICLPILRERVQLPTGGYEVAVYRPVFLLASYLQMGDFQPLLLMVGFSFIVYSAVSLILAVIIKIFKKKKNKK